MTKCTDTINSCAFLLVNADLEEVTNLHQDMPDRLWIEAPKGWPFSKESDPIAGAFQAIIIFAHPKSEDQVLAICKHICEENIMDGVPLLVAVNQYQMSLANEVRRLPRGNFIFTPIEEQALFSRIEASQGKQL